MPNTNQEPIATAKETTSYKGEEVKLIAESFNEPIKQAESLSLFTRVRFIHGTIEVAKTRYYEVMMDEEELKTLLNEIKSNIADFFKD